MNIAFPDADVKGFRSIINELQLPDVNDRHVLAAAIKAKVDFIITFNAKHFPPQYANSFSVQIIHPDYYRSELKYSLPFLTLLPKTICYKSID